MSFLSPAWLLLTASFIGAVLWMHTFRPRAKRIEIASTFLWERVLARQVRTARWRRLVRSVLLALQLLTLILVGLALARPALRLGMVSQTHAIWLLDGSASMRAVDVTPSRFDAAREWIRTEIRTHPAARHSLILVTRTPRLLMTETASVTQLEAALDQARPTDAVADWDSAASLVESLIDSHGRAQVYVVSDGAYDNGVLSRLRGLAGRATLTPHLVAGSGGNASGNVGITAFTARPIGSALGDYQVLLTVQDFTTAGSTFRLEVANDDGPWQAADVRLGPGERRDLLWPIRYRGADVLRARLRSIGDATDALKVDNEAYLVFSEPQLTRVLLTGSGNYYLQRGLAVFPGVVTVEQPKLEGQNLGPYHLLIVNGDPLPSERALRGRTTLWIGGDTAPSAPGGTGDDSPMTTGRSPRVTWWNRTHPLSRFVNWDDVSVERLRPAPLDPGEQVLVETEDGPLISALDDGEFRLVRFHFRLEESNFPLRVAFPVFLQNLLEWAHPQGWNVVQENVPAGDPVSLQYAADETGAWPTRSTVIGPAGRSQWGLSNGRLSFAETHQVGLYQGSSGEQSFMFAVNLVEAQESDIRPRAEWFLGSASPREAPETAGDGAVPGDQMADERPVMAHRQTSRWPLLLLAALAVAAEGWLYGRHRRGLPLRVPKNAQQSEGS